MDQLNQQKLALLYFIFMLLYRYWVKSLDLANVSSISTNNGLINFSYS